ncbi:MAG TPA: formate dehydrogenase subunit delta [Rudaea sp.]|jgi:formate dehydrogenase subunit delta
MNAERLAEMANDIANFFAAEPDRSVAIDGVCNHLRKYWEPRMRRQIVAYVHDHGAAGMSDLARAGVEKLATIDPLSTAKTA